MSATPSTLNELMTAGPQCWAMVDVSEIEKMVIESAEQSDDGYWWFCDEVVAAVPDMTSVQHVNDKVCYDWNFFEYQTPHKYLPDNMPDEHDCITVHAVPDGEEKSVLSHEIAKCIKTRLNAMAGNLIIFVPEGPGVKPN